MKVGQATGMGLALAVGAAVTAVRLLWGGGVEPMRFALGCGIGFFAVLAPIGLFCGSRYDRLKEWAEKDPLTGIFNRRFLQQGFPRLRSQADRRRKRFSVLLFDVNEFKMINDIMGHAKGDEVLRLIAGTLKAASRHGEIAGRWGGDQFLLLCPYGDRSSIESLQRDIAGRLAQIPMQGNRSLHVSMGAAVYPDDGLVLEELVQAADRRMYADKKGQQEAYAERLQA